MKGGGGGADRGISMYIACRVIVLVSEYRDPVTSNCLKLRFSVLIRIGRYFRAKPC